MNNSIGSPSPNNAGFFESLTYMGKVFTHSDYYTFGASETKIFLFDPSTCCRKIITSPLFFSATVGPITIDIKVNVVVSANGTALTVFNRNATSSNTNLSSIYLAPTITNPGVKFSGSLVPSTGTAPATGRGHEAGKDEIFIMDDTKKYTIDVTNTNGAGTLVQIRFTWAEI